MATEDVSNWLNDNLSDILSFPVPPDLTQYILTIENDRDLEDYMKTLLDLTNPKHRAFLKRYKVLRHAGEGKQEQEVVINVKGERKKKQKNNDASKGDANANVENEEPEVMGGAKPKRKNKFVNLYSPEGQSKDIIYLKGRHFCECQASKHRLINNCLKCGRIVCAQEGSGPCLFCGQLVCSPEEERIINEDTKQSKTLYDTLMKEIKPEELEKALAQRNRLLEYDRTVQQRSKVIDDESDYFSSTSIWLTKQERELLRQQEERAHARKHASRLEKKFTLDFAGRQVIEDSDDEFGDEKGNAGLRTDAGASIQKRLTDNHTHPDFTDSFQPTFMSEEEPENHKTRGAENLSEKNINCKVQDKELLLISDSGACLSMHQPWASLLVRGIKKHEGRTWYTSHRGRLWIASASKVPTEDSIKECENFYRLFYGNEKLEFPATYPTGCLLGCVSLVDCLPQEEYRARFPNGESESPFVLVCEEPQALDISFPMSGSHKIYKMDGRIHQAARKALLRVAKQAKCEKSNSSVYF